MPLKKGDSAILLLKRFQYLSASCVAIFEMELVFFDVKSSKILDFYTTFASLKLYIQNLLI